MITSNPTAQSAPAGGAPDPLATTRGAGSATPSSGPGSGSVTVPGPAARRGTDGNVTAGARIRSPWLWRATLIAAFAELALTAFHHVYGGVIYESAWRINGQILGVIALILLLVGYWRRSSVWWGRTFVLTAGLVVGGVIGWFEGGYNHVLKDALYASGVDRDLLSRMYPAPFYVPPGNVVFEVTGVLQWGIGVIVTTLAAVLRARTLRRAGTDGAR